MKVFKVNGSEEKDQQGLGFKAWSMCRKPQSLRGSTYGDHSIQEEDNTNRPLGLSQG